jgi:hypothetical protein
MVDAVGRPGSEDELACPVVTRRRQEPRCAVLAQAADDDHRSWETQRRPHPVQRCAVRLSHGPTLTRRGQRVREELGEPVSEREVDGTSGDERRHQASADEQPPDVVRQMASAASAGTEITSRG